MKNIGRNNQEQGFATIIVAIVLVVILSLLTLGFAQLMRNEQNQTTNRQLSNQAYYAAESGINDALRALDNGYTADKTFCGPDSSNQYLSDNNVDTTAVAQKAASQWTCLLIDPSPTSLEYSPVDTVTPSVFTAQVVDNNKNGVPLDSLTVAWKDADNSLNPTFRLGSGVSNSSFPQAANWSSIGMLRFGVTPLVAPLSRTVLNAEAITTFLYPCQLSGSCSNDNVTENYASPTQAPQGQILNGGCSTTSTPFYCHATITFSPSLPAGTALLFNLRSIYAKTHVYITANNGSAHLYGAQVVIDSTGRSQDVLKRIQVRAPNQSHYEFPGFALDSLNGVCKQLSVYPGFAQGCGY